MNGWIIAYIVVYAMSWTILLFKLSESGNGMVKVSVWNLLTGPIITFGLLYMGGAFS